MSDRALAGAVALVTDAGSGVGAAIAHRLARAGAAVALVARRRDRLDRVTRDIAARCGRTISVETDITEPAGAYHAVQDTHDRLGRLDILVNNAGVMLFDTALHTPIGEWDRMVSLNVTALLHVTHAAVPYLIDAAATAPRRVADLVNVGMSAGHGNSVHHLTRCGLAGFTESLRQELLVERVRVGLVEAGPGGADDVADAIGYVVTRDRRVAVTELRTRSGAPDAR